VNGRNGREGTSMRNPWTTKNPAMSLWLSAANRVAGSARGQATAAAKRQVAATQADMTRQIIDFWSGKAALPVSRKNSRR
jgi:hypothetical protein